MKKNYFVIPFIALVTALSGSIATEEGMGWYKTIHLPSWTPAGALIGTVWTIIFILTAISALLYWNKAKRGKKFEWTIGIFVINAILNLKWTIVFFGMHLMGVAIAVAAALGISVIVLMVMTWRTSRTASLLLLPYAAWTCFATYLTYAVWALNA